MTAAVPPLTISSHHLTITTESHILCYDNDGLSSVFTSGSRGIVAAKEAKNGTLAIADDQLVVLHKVGKSLERSYRLKGTEVQQYKPLISTYHKHVELHMPINCASQRVNHPARFMRPHVLLATGSCDVKRALLS